MAIDENAAVSAPGTEPSRPRKKRWGDKAAAVETPTAAIATTATTSTSSAATDAKAKVLAMQESIRARLAAAKSKANVLPTPTASTGKRAAPEDAALQNTVKRAKHFELDLSQTAPTYKKEIEAAKEIAAKPKVNPYLTHQSADQPEGLQDEIYDPSLARAAKPRQRHKELSFVQPGYYQELAEKKRQLAAKAQASGYVSGRKTGHTIHAADTWTASSDYYAGSARDDELFLPPRADANPETNMPLAMEWWDVELLPSKLKKQVAAEEAQALTKRSKAAMALQAKYETNEMSTDEPKTELIQSCFEHAALTHSKTASLVQHIVPIRPPNFVESTQPPTLHLTRKELKRQRKLRRQAKQRELQDLQSAGLVPAPEPRLTLRNFIQVLGDQAFLDPSQMEQKVAEQMAKRQQAHLERNERNKLTKEQRAEKRAKKLQEDTSAGVHVSIFVVQDMTHPYHRAKVDLNAQQHYISGGVLECDHPKLACVIYEGGPKAIQRMRRLMLVRMKWTGPDEGDDEDEDDDDDASGLDDVDQVTHKFNPDNRCELVWQGMAVKRLFKGFSFQACETSDQARKILKGKGVEHYWDQVLAHSQGSKKESIQLKLASNDSDDEDDNPYAIKEEEDIIMADANE